MSDTVKIEHRGVLKHKIFLYLTEFFSGMSVMAVELGASRLLAPYFSSSQIVWTIIIGTIMIAMALGNVYGGRMADKNPNPDKLYMRLIIAAVWIAAIPFIGKFVILGICGLLVVTISTNFLIWASFLACMIVFVFPLFILGTTTPCLVKYSMESLDDSGKTVGILNASNTIGSIIGTFVPTFISIPAFGTAITFLIFSGILLVLGLVYFISTKTKLIKSAVSIVLFVVCCFFSTSIGFAFWQNDLAYEGESVYNYLQVSESDTKVILSTNVLFGVQSVYQKNDDLTGFYYDYALAAPLMTEQYGEETIDILILGMGTGTYALQCDKYFDDITVEGVEIDEKITSLAHEYFHLPENIKVTTYDGRAFLNVCDKKYDVIMVDAYQDITIPFQMSSVEFFTMVKNSLNEGGVMIVNMNMYNDSEGSINQYLSDTIASVFDNVYTVNTTGTNKELFASDNGNMMNNLSVNASSLDNAKLRSLMERITVNCVEYEGGDKILTDDKAPVELLGMRVIDGMISEQLEYYKNLIKEEGLAGLLK